MCSIVEAGLLLCGLLDGVAATAALPLRDMTAARTLLAVTPDFMGTAAAAWAAREGFSPTALLRASRVRRTADKTVHGRGCSTVHSLQTCGWLPCIRLKVVGVM